MRNLNEFMSEDDLHQLHDFFVQAEAAEINQDLANRLRASGQSRFKVLVNCFGIV